MKNGWIILELIVAILISGWSLLHIIFINTENEMKSDAWLKMLPDCPCELPEAELVGDGWAVDLGNTEKHHPGATICFRSYPAIETSEGMSGQQCCYDENGRLITTGRAAGTPDRESSCGGERDNGKMKISPRLILHYFKDVLPSRRMTGEEYRLKWKPNKGEGCIP